MKVTPRQYAQSLYESLKDKEGKGLKAVLSRFVRLLGERRELGKAVAIMAAFQEIWEREEGELEAELVTARSLDKAATGLVSGYLQAKTGAKEVSLREELDKELIGGFILRYRNKIVDASLRSSLDDLKSKLES